MWGRRHGVISLVIWMQAGMVCPVHRPVMVGLLCGIVVGACDSRPSAPESRAEYFVEKLISEPQAVEELRSVARLAKAKARCARERSADAHRTDLSACPTSPRCKLGLRVAGSQRPATDSRVVSVVVSEGTAVLNEGAAVRFQVELQKQEDAWLVTRLRSD